MSHEIEYIGMDVHKEATVVAVLNGSGKVVMESIVETKASSPLQFIRGLRGEVHVTWEEGAWAAWLYDLLQPSEKHVIRAQLRNRQQNGCGELKSTDAKRNEATGADKAFSDS